MIYDRNAESGGAAPPAYMTPTSPPRVFDPTSGSDSPYVPTPVPTATAPPPPPMPSPTATVDAGYTPDYAALLQNDPSYLAAKTAADTASAAATAARREKLRQAYIQYGGELPPGFSDQFGDIDQATKDAAGVNQHSVIAQLADNYSRSGEQFKRQLAARGGLQSSELTYGQDQLDRGYGQQRYDAANQFLGQAGSVYGDYLGTANANASNLSTAISNAEQNVYANPAYRPSAPVTANYDASASAQYSQPVYTDDTGNQYDSGGNPFDPLQAIADSVSGIKIGYAG